MRKKLTKEQKEYRRKFYKALKSVVVKVPNYLKVKNISRIEIINETTKDERKRHLESQSKNRRQLLKVYKP